MLHQSFQSRIITLQQTYVFIFIFNLKSTFLYAVFKIFPQFVVFTWLPVDNNKVDSTSIVVKEHHVVFRVLFLEQAWHWWRDRQWDRQWNWLYIDSVTAVGKTAGQTVEQAVKQAVGQTEGQTAGHIVRQAVEQAVEKSGRVGSGAGIWAGSGADSGQTVGRQWGK